MPYLKDRGGGGGSSRSTPTQTNIFQQITRTVQQVTRAVTAIPALRPVIQAVERAAKPVVQTVQQTVQTAAQVMQVIQAVQRVVQPSLQAIQPVIQYVTGKIQPANTSQGSTEHLQDAPPPKLETGKVEVDAQSKRGEKAEKPDRNAINVRETLDEMGNPILRDIKYKMREQPEIVTAVMKSSTTPEKAFDRLLAKWGRDEELDAKALKALGLQRGGHPSTKIDRFSQSRRHLIHFQQTEGPPASQPVDKAITTIKALRDVAEEYQKLLQLRETDPQRATEYEAEFREKWQGLDPDDAAWFADEGMVTLDEMIAMVLAAEGGSIAQDEELIILLANRARTYLLGAAPYMEAANLNLSDFTADQLLTAYKSNDPNEREAARRIINNVFAHDDSFIGAQDRLYELDIAGARTEGEQTRAWLNLTQNPESVSSGLGDVIIGLSLQLVELEEWNPQNTRLIGGRSISTQANINQIPGTLAETLNVLSIPEVRRVPTEIGDAVFLNDVQQQVLSLIRQGVTDSDTIALDLVARRFWNCETLQQSSPHLLIASGCKTCDELRNDPQLQQYSQSNGCS